MQVISLEFAKELKEKEFLVISGRKFCGIFNLRLSKLCEKASGMVYDAALTGDSIDSEENTCVASLSNSQLNTSLSRICQFLIKLHNTPSCSRSRYGKRKLSLINNELTKRVVTALKVFLHEVTSKNTLIEHKSKKKAEDFDTLWIR